MAEDLAFPRLIYRGDPDTLGTGADLQGVPLTSETRRCEDAADLRAALKDGWRLTRELDKPVAAAAVAADDPPAAPVDNPPAAAPRKGKQ